MIQGIEVIFQDKEKMLKGLKKWIYEKNTEAFIEKHGAYFEEMSDLMTQSEDRKEMAEEIAVTFTKAVQKAYAGRRGKIKSLVQMDLNMFMIYYVFPTILGQVSGGKMLTDKLCEVWNSTFTLTKIEYADYETLRDSFKDKILGIF
ncbi:MAG: hypothetical protein U0L05_09275 [Schaedlerella sp.]|nr:hypothetical protein [Schaedlerella sp.]